MEIEQLLKKYQATLKEQCTLDVVELKNIQMKLPGYKHYWAGLCVQHKRDLAQLTRQKDKVKQGMIKKLGDAEVELSKTALDRRISQFDEVKQFDDEMEDMEHLIAYVEKAEKIVGQIGWDIKNIIELQKLETL